MADFGQAIQGLHKAGDSIVSTDQHIALLAKDSSDNYAYITLDANGKLEVTGGTEYNVGDTAGATDTGKVVLVIRDDVLATLSEADGDYTFLRTDSVGALWVTISGDVNVTATDLDIRDLDGATDSVLLSDGTNDLVINADGSINVVTSSQALDSVYVYGTANLVKDTATTVVTRSPSADESYSGIHVSGAGYCEWQVQFGTTASEATIVSFWTTPSNPTHWFDMPDYLEVGSGETVLVRATNREKKASPASDFAGHASLIRKV